jgi:hypothetical protein
MKMKVLVTCCLALALLAFTTGTAFAKSVKAKAPLQEGNGNCGANETGDPVLGSATFKRTGNAVTLKIKLKGGAPDETYEAELFGNASFCELIGVVFDFTTNSKGNGGGQGSIAVPEGETEFFADPFGETPVFSTNDTPYVSLP